MANIVSIIFIFANKFQNEQKNDEYKQLNN